MGLYLTDQLMYASYFAPRGRQRMFSLGQQLSQRYLSPNDLLIGVIGDSGAGKSSLIKGMFPGLELTNDDDGVNIRPLPLLKDEKNSFFNPHTYHLDLRFELAFTQIHELSQAVQNKLNQGKRVIVEHFDLLYPVIGRNADIMIGVGAEVMLVKPTLFGPDPAALSELVKNNLKFRKMAHSAEDLTEEVLRLEYGITAEYGHRDVRKGFALELKETPNVDMRQLEAKVKEYIEQEMSIAYVDDSHIRIGDNIIRCTGPRLHVKNTSDIDNFRLYKDYVYDEKTKTCLLIGLIGQESEPLYGLSYTI